MRARTVLIGVCLMLLAVSAAFAPLVLPIVTDAERAGEEVGLGLELALVRGIIELHGGSVSAASPGPGLGSTLTARMPLLTQDTAANPDPPRADAG